MAVAKADPLYDSGAVELRMWPDKRNWIVEVRFKPTRQRFSDGEMLEMLNEASTQKAFSMDGDGGRDFPPSVRFVSPWVLLERTYVARYAFPGPVASRNYTAWISFSLGMANAIRDVNPTASVMTINCDSLFRGLAISKSNSAPDTSNAVGRDERAPAVPYIINNPGLTPLQGGRWRLREPSVILTAPHSNSRAVATIQKGTLLTAFAIEIHVLRPGIAEATRDGEVLVETRAGLPTSERERRVQYRKGERFYSLHYVHAGYCTVWAKGVVGIAECDGNSMEGGLPLFRDLGHDRSGGGNEDIWALIVTEDGRRGWIKNPDAQGMSKHDEPV